MVKDYSIREAAKELGITLPSVYSALWSNKFPGARKIDGKWAIPAEDVKTRLSKERGHGHK